MKHIWRSLEDDRDVSDAYARRHPDAVYDAADPEWMDILYIDEDDLTDDELDALESGDSEAFSDIFEEVSDIPADVLQEYEWDDTDVYDDDGWYEVEIGIDYGADT